MKSIRKAPIFQQVRSRRKKWFTVSADGFTILPMPSQGWSFGSDDRTLIHTFGETARVNRNIDRNNPMVEGGTYLVKAHIGGTIGDNVIVILGSGAGSAEATQLYSAGVGDIEFTAVWTNTIAPFEDSIISFSPGAEGDTDVVISNISVTKI